jgi:hydroxyquinol 1,2-dioxygenase
VRNLDADTITRAVIARHAGAPDARFRELMTSLVQHLHAFAREVKLSEAEWASGIGFLAETAARRSDAARRDELRLLSDTLGLSTLVAALSQRRPEGCTEASSVGAIDNCEAAAAVGSDHLGAPALPCFVSGRVRSLDGGAVRGALVRVWPGGEAPLATGDDGCFRVRCLAAEPVALPHDGPVGRMLRALGRDAWRPAHLRFEIRAPGFEPLVTQVYRADGAYLDADAAFGVRRSLVADWARHDAGRTPDGGSNDGPFYTLDYEFVLNPCRSGQPAGS